MERNYNLVNIKNLKHIGDRYVEVSTDQTNISWDELVLVYAATTKIEDSSRTLNYSLILLPQAKVYKQKHSSTSWVGNYSELLLPPLLCSIVTTYMFNQCCMFPCALHWRSNHEDKVCQYLWNLWPPPPAHVDHARMRLLDVDLYIPVYLNLGLLVSAHIPLTSEIYL